jgi:hypothetical protein
MALEIKIAFWDANPISLFDKKVNIYKNIRHNFSEDRNILRFGWSRGGRYCQEIINSKQIKCYIIISSLIFTAAKNCAGSCWMFTY